MWAYTRSCGLWLQVIAFMEGCLGRGSGLAPVTGPTAAGLRGRYLLICPAKVLQAPFGTNRIRRETLQVGIIVPPDLVQEITQPGRSVAHGWRWVGMDIGT
ncbi:hypothetical protein HOY82DRAFT_573473, partial [Tuber indicum]